MKYLLLRLKRFCGFLVGIVFLISGILKLLDPVGSGLVMDEYFSFLHIGFMGFAAKPLGVMFALIEALIGTALMTGVWRKISGIIALAFQGFFTLVTVLLVIFNPEMDCGCFGEAVHLTHWQTFSKNLILLALLSAYYFPTKMLGQPKPRKYVSFSIVAVSLVLLTGYSLRYIPLVDFTDFKPSAILQAANTGTADADRFESVFVYEKDGEEETFSLGHLPDSTWTFVRTETRERFYADDDLVLSIMDDDGIYHDEYAAEGKVVVISVYDVDRRPAAWVETASFIDVLAHSGFTPFLLVSSSYEDVRERLEGLPDGVLPILESCMYYSDYKTLVTMNRSNGGATYFDDGLLIRKWAASAYPDESVLKDIYDSANTEILIGQSTRGSLTFQSFLLYVFAVLLLL